VALRESKYTCECVALQYLELERRLRHAPIPSRSAFDLGNWLTPSAGTIFANVSPLIADDTRSAVVDAGEFDRPRGWVDPLLRSAAP
jgi:hypothetical protein